MAEPNRLVWFAAVAALGVLPWMLVRRSGRSAGFLLLGIAAEHLPWLFVPERTIYFFYAIVFEPFLVIGLAYALRCLVARPRAVVSRAPAASRALGTALISPALRRRLGAVALALLLLLSVLVAAKHLPHWYAIPI